jgi:hypothetical protein
VKPLVVTFKWSAPGYRSKFTSDHVNVMRAMLERHYRVPHEFMCITDDAAGIDGRVSVMPLWSDFADIPNASWPGNGPSCYRRLKVFSDWFADQVGHYRRVICIDLDAVIVGNVTPLFQRHIDSRWMLNVWRTGNRGTPICASVFAFLTGTLDSLLWSMRGSDQAWLAYKLGHDVPGWTKLDGVYDYNTQIAKRVRASGYAGLRKAIYKHPAAHILPTNARLICFTGQPDPWSEEAQHRSPWIKEHYRL